MAWYGPAFFDASAPMPKRTARMGVNHRIAVEGEERVWLGGGAEAILRGIWPA
jgi:hypothetical protein